MKCERMKELILIDYLDGYLKGKQKEFLEKHLARCLDCQEFARRAKKSVFEPFQNIEKPDPPESAWLKIKKSIAREEKKTNRLTDFWERLGLSIIPKPLLALSTLMILIFVIGGLIPYTKISHQQFNTREQAEYLAQLMEASADLSTENMDDEGGFETLVEQYFL